MTVARKGGLAHQAGPVESAEVIGVLTLVSQRLEKLEQGVAGMQSLLQTGAARKEWYTTGEFADEVSRAEYTVRQWLNRGRLKGQKIENGREWRVHRGELERYQKEGLLPEPKSCG